MTNKMPVVGKRYDWKHSDNSVLIDEIHADGEVIYKIGRSYLSSIRGEDFWDFFEELPTTLQKTEEVQISDKGEVSEVERASNLLRLAIGSAEARAMTGETGIVEKVLSRAKSLIDALEAEKLGDKKEVLGDNLGEKQASNLEASVPNNMSKPEPKIDMKEECVDSVSIWKDVGELSAIHQGNENIEIILKSSGGDCNLTAMGDESLYFKNMSKYCTLTDFINSFEQMQKDIEKLKRNN